MTFDNRDFNNYADDAHYSELMKFLSESQNMRETAKNSLKQSLYAATGAFAGSFALGPIGGLLGGVSGSILGYLQSDNYDGAIIALTKLESERQKVSRNHILTFLFTLNLTVQEVSLGP